MNFKIKKATLFFIVGSFINVTADASEGDKALIGYWQKEGEVVIVEIKKSNADFSGTIVRADWEPGLIGNVFVKNITIEQPEKKWSGEFYDSKTAAYRKGTISLKKGQTMKIKVKGRKRTVWTKAQSKNHIK